MEECQTGADLRSCYYELELGEALCYRDADARLHRIVLLAAEEEGLKLNVNGRLIALPFGHRRSPAEANPPGEMLHIAHVGALEIGAEVSRHYMDGTVYDRTTLNLQAAARLWVCDRRTLPPAGEYVFPVQGYPWNYGDCWLINTHVYGYHLGQDVYMPRGAQVVSACAGTVVDVREFDPQTQEDDYWGRMLAILGDDQLVYTYVHCDRLEPGLRIGARVQAGDPIGPLGKAGFERTPILPHLHFEMFVLPQPERFRFAFEERPSLLKTPLRILPPELEGFTVNPFAYMVAWYTGQD